MLIQYGSNKHAYAHNIYTRANTIQTCIIYTHVLIQYKHAYAHIYTRANNY